MSRLGTTVAASVAVALLALAATPTPARASWFGTRGNGQKTTQPRTVGAFDAIRLEGSIDAAVKVGPSASVAVTIDENLQPLVQTRLDGTTLVVKVEDASWSGEGKVTITLPALRAFAIDGSGDAVIEGGSGDLKLAISGSGDLRWSGQATRLDASIAGSGDMKLGGEAESVHFSIAGSGDIAAGPLKARNAEVGVSGSGNVELTMTGGTLSASVAGSGDVTWHGEARVERAAVAGSGSITRK
jgi:hypothetical protein